MKTGTILHHKYFNGVVPTPKANRYKELASEYFGNFGMYGTGMFGMIAKGPNVETDYDWKNVDLLVAYANENLLDIHYNTVITGYLDIFPDWYKSLPEGEKLVALEAHVRAVVSRYKERVNFFKLVNEVVREPAEHYLGTALQKEELITRIFKWAVDEYPEGKYMLNEFGALIREEIREPFLELFSIIRDLGARIDLIGEQAHSGYHPRPFFLPTDTQLQYALDEIHDKTNIPLMITEFDIGPKNGDYEGGEINTRKPLECDGIRYSNWYEYQVFAYKHFKELCAAKGYVEGFYYWSFAEDPTLTWERQECGFLDHDLEPKLEMKDYIRELQTERRLQKEGFIRNV